MLRIRPHAYLYLPPRRVDGCLVVEMAALDQDDLLEANGTAYVTRLTVLAEHRTVAPMKPR